VASIEAYAAQPRADRLARLGRAADELAAALAARTAAALARRPDARNWAATEVLCHLRDNEEWFRARIKLILAVHEPPLPRNDPDRWAEERQYLRHDAAAALAAFRRRREETLALLRGLGAGDWSRAGVHLDSRGRRTIDEFLSVMAWHDDNHLDQLRRALAAAEA
jgi:hypothetical protein